VDALLPGPRRRICWRLPWILTVAALMTDMDDGYGRGDPLAVRAWGSLQLRAAVSAARAGIRGRVITTWTWRGPGCGTGTGTRRLLSWSTPSVSRRSWSAITRWHARRCGPWSTLSVRSHATSCGACLTGSAWICSDGIPLIHIHTVTGSFGHFDSEAFHGLTYRGA
jgi:hypothetical protein